MAENGQSSGANVGLNFKRTIGVTSAALFWFFGAGFSAQAQDSLPGRYDGPEITYEQIYNSPEDYRLNFNYALQEAEAGNLGNAASALERLLFVQPNWHSARLLYAAVLYRLDDVQGARRELSQLDGQPLTPSEESRLREYRRLFSKTPEQWAREGRGGSTGADVSGRLEAGLGYDNNAASAFADDTFFLGKEEDTSFIARARADARVPFGASDWSGIIGATGLMRRYQDVSLINHDAVQAYGGIQYSNDVVKIAARYDLGQTRIDGNTYVKMNGPAVALDYSLSDDTLVVTKLSLHDESFEDFRPGTFDSQRSGDRLDVSFGLSHRFSTNTQMRGLVLYVDKEADNLLYAYDGLGFRVDGHHLFENENYVRGLIQMRDLEYAVGSRGEKRSYGEFVFGMPIKNIGSAMGQDWEDSFQNWSLELAVDHVNRDFENFGLTSFSNTGAELRLVWDF